MANNLSNTTEPLRLLLYDATCRGRPLLPGLTHSWIAGALMYRALGHLDCVFGANNWRDGLQWLATVEPDRPVSEIQFWGHGKWGNARIAGEKLDSSALASRHQYHSLLSAIRDRLTGPDALWWFRTCETFGARPGHNFARQWTDFFDGRAAGHTYIIGPWQSGLHCLAPGQTPDWPLDEGLSAGSIEEPEEALWSKPGEPNTITCFQNNHPELRR